MPKAKTFIVDIAVYDRQVLVSVGQTREQLNRTIQKYFPKQRIKGVKYHLLKNEDAWHAPLQYGNGLIILSQYDFNVDTVSTVVHEAVHIASKMLHYVGVALSEDSEETFAYTIDYLTREILTQLNKES